MERLIVKNFGPIKEADIELNKYVVLIGDTSTGKSVLAKLIAIFRDSCNILNFKHEVDKIDIVHDFGSSINKAIIAIICDSDSLPLKRLLVSNMRTATKTNASK